MENTVLEGTDVGAMLTGGGVAADADQLTERNHGPFVAAFVALLAGVGVLAARGVLAVVGHFFFAGSVA